jgi:hypothetical protein
MISWGKLMTLGDKPAPVPLCSTRISHDDTSSSPRLCGEKPASNRLSYATAPETLQKCIQNVRRHEGMRTLGIIIRVVKDNIRTDLKEKGYERVDCIRLAKDTDRRQAFVTTVKNLSVQRKGRHFLTS